MTIDQYLAAEKVTLTELSRRTGISTVSLWRIRNGQQNASTDTIRAIIAATDGKVTADAIVNARAA